MDELDTMRECMCPYDVVGDSESDSTMKTNVLLQGCNNTIYCYTVGRAQIYKCDCVFAHVYHSLHFKAPHFLIHADIRSKLYHSKCWSNFEGSF